MIASSPLSSLFLVSHRHRSLLNEISLLSLSLSFSCSFRSLLITLSSACPLSLPPCLSLSLLRETVALPHSSSCLPLLLQQSSVRSDERKPSAGTTCSLLSVFLSRKRVYVCSAALFTPRERCSKESQGSANACLVFCPFAECLAAAAAAASLAVVAQGKREQQQSKALADGISSSSSKQDSESTRHQVQSR